MGRRQDVRHPLAAPKPPGLQQIELRDETYALGEVIQVNGLAGEYKIRRFDERPHGLEVEVFGGPSGHASIRTVLAERIIPRDGSQAAVEHRSKTLSSDPIRDAIAAHGEVRVPLDGEDPAERKRLVNRVFSRAYSLGLKGKFKVRVEDGTVIGWRTDA